MFLEVYGLTFVKQDSQKTKTRKKEARTCSDVRAVVWGEGSPSGVYGNQTDIKNFV
jgi:hypothetical protein